MFTSTSGHYLTRLAVVVVGSIAAATALLYSLSTSAAPPVEWVPSSLDVTVGAGQTAVAAVSFTISTNVASANVRVVPELAPYIQASPSSFGKLSKGQRVQVVLTVSPSVAAPLGSIEGTIQLRSKNTLAKPLPVVVNINRTFSDIANTFSFDYLQGWQVDDLGSLVQVSSPETEHARNDPEQAPDVPADINVRIIPNAEHLALDAFVSQFERGWFTRYASVEHAVIDGRAALQYSDLASSVGRAPALALFVAISESQVLLVTAPGHASDLTSERAAGFEQLVQTLQFP